MPSGDVAAVVELSAIATKTPLPKVTAIQNVEAERVLAVHVMPSVDVAAAVELYAIATKTPFPKVTSNH